MTTPIEGISNSLVEDMARAMALNEWPGNEWTIECFSEREQDEYRSHAAAALSALKDRLPVDDRELVETVLSRIGQDYDGECHLTEAEARRLTDRIISLSAGRD